MPARPTCRTPTGPQPWAAYGRPGPPGYPRGRAEVGLERDDDLLPVPVVHNYGHGGAGITTSWGCAQDVANLVRHA